MLYFLFFFKQKTAYEMRISDWSSDVCSSDLQTDKPYRIDLRAAAGATRAHARGTLVNPFQFRSFDLRMALSGKNLEDLYPLLGISLPPTSPYALDGR